MQRYLLPSYVISACWITFAIVWLLAALFTKRSVYQESGRQRLRYWLFLALGLFLVFHQRVPDLLQLRVIPGWKGMGWSAAILCAIGLAVCIWARLTLGRNWSGTVTFKEGHELIERGPYRLVRHPIYTGMLIMFVATVVARGHLGGIIGVLLVFITFWIKLGQEEKVMLEHFPERYPAYQRRVKRLSPFVI